MSDKTHSTDPFIDRVTTVIHDHVGEEDFGVAELADEMSMSRSTLLRKVKGATGRSVAMFIRQQRLLHAKELLHDSSLTVSEVAFRTGFSSSSYFARCYREEYGYPPGEESAHMKVDNQTRPAIVESAPSINGKYIGIFGVILATLGIGLAVWWPSSIRSTASPKTIAVLPFLNDSEDSTNLYLINGLMAAIIDNLHQIDDIQVTSRTTIERYRGALKTVPELADELGVDYLIEGSGQKIGPRILLTLRLIDAQADTLIWTRRFQRETTDIFQLQAEVSTSIAREIDVSISLEEQQRVEQPPTENLVAYDHYLKGLEQIKTETREGLIAGIEAFQQAITEDPQFAHPHAYLAISYYFLDLYQTEQSHLADINTYADKALLLDPSLNESLIGKALYYMQAGQYELAISFFYKVLDRNPDSGWIHNLLSTIYNVHLPNTEEYLRHAIQGIKYVAAGQDSGSVSGTYLHLGNALAQNGFLAESEPFIEKSLHYQSGNRFAEILSIYIRLGQTNDLEEAYQRLQLLYAKDSTFLATIQEAGKIAYYLGEYEEAWKYYHRFLEMKEAAGLNIYPGEDIKIAHVLQLLNRPYEAILYRDRYYDYLQGEESIYRDLGMAVYHTFIGENDLALDYLESFSKEEGYQFWFVMFIDQDPILNTLESVPDYQRIITQMKDRFWSQHQQLRKALESEGLL